MTTITPSQMKRLHQLLNKTGQADNKKDLVIYYSGGRVESSTKLYYVEAASLIKHLESYEKASTPAAEDEALQKMRKKVIYYAHLMKWELPGGKADMKRINGWCVKYGQFKKELNSHSKTELSKLITQIENVYKTFLSSIAR